MIRSWIGRALGAGAVVVTVLAAGAVSASAAPHGEGLTRVQFGYTDSATPRQAHDVDDGEWPVGTRVDADGVTHTSRGYVSFDLARYEGRKTYDATLFFEEARAAECPKRAYELWRVKGISSTPTWNRAPAPIGKVGELTTAPSFCPQSFQFDIGAAVADALQHRQRYVSFELRIAEAFEADPAYGRTLRHSFNMGFVDYDTPPTVDKVHLYNSGKECSALKPYPALGGRRLEAVGYDADEADGTNLSMEYAVWPKSSPEARQTFMSTNPFGRAGRVNPVEVPSTALVDGETYGWQARVSDGAEVSGWSPKCFFRYDATNPGAPTVTDQVPPAAGEPLRLTLSGNGNRDVAGFQYNWNFNGGVNACNIGGDYGQMVCPDVFSLPSVLRANAPGGTATLVTNAPREGPARLYVRSLDLAGNVSSETVYETSGRGGPTVSPVGGEPFWGQEIALRVTPHADVTSPVSTYGYRLELDGEEQFIQPDADGSATIRFTPDPQQSMLDVSVWSYHANGFVSPKVSWQTIFGPWPGVRSTDFPMNVESGAPGVAGTFEFGPPMDFADPVAYRWSIDFGDETEVPAREDGTAAVTWTPPAAGWYTLIVSAVAADGTTSDSNWYSFGVAAGG